MRDLHDERFLAREDDGAASSALTPRARQRRARIHASCSAKTPHSPVKDRRGPSAKTAAAEPITARQRANPVDVRLQ